MKSPFPGMDPYLEWYWGDIHTSLTTYARDQLSPQLPSDLRARVEEYVAVDEENGETVAFVPDVRVEERRVGGEAGGASPSADTAVAEPLVVPIHIEPPTLRYLRIVDVRSGNRRVTAIEFLSLANKKGKKGRTAYRKKQRKLIAGGANLVEVDLLRAGGYVLRAPQDFVPLDYQRPYRVCVYRTSRADHAEVYRVSLREPLPTIRIPLRKRDADVRLNLQDLVTKSYENGRYDDIDYKAEPVPPLDSEDARWADALLKDKGLR